MGGRGGGTRVYRSQVMQRSSMSKQVSLTALVEGGHLLSGNAGPAVFLSRWCQRTEWGAGQKPRGKVKGTILPSCRPASQISPGLYDHHPQVYSPVGDWPAWREVATWTWCGSLSHHSTGEPLIVRSNPQIQGSLLLSNVPNTKIKTGRQRFRVYEEIR